MKKEYRTSRIKGFMIGVLVFLLTFGVGTVFAYWAGTIKNPTNTTQNPDIIIGEAEDVDTIFTWNGLAAGYGDLVPEGRIRPSTNDVKIIEITFTVKWEEDGSNSIKSGDTKPLADLQVSAVIKGNAKQIELIKVIYNDLYQNIALTGDTVTVTITLTLTEPTSQADYTALQTDKEDIELIITLSLQNVRLNP